MSDTTTLKGLLQAHPELAKHLPLVVTGDYSLQDLYEFNPYAEKKFIPEESVIIGDPGDGPSIGVPIVQLDEMYKASLMVKAQVELLVRMKKAGVPGFGWL